MDRQSFTLRLIAFLAFVAILAGATVVAYDTIGSTAPQAQVNPLVDERTTAPGRTVAFPIVVKGTGNAATLSVDAGDTAGLQIEAPDTVEVPGDGATGFFVDVTVPEDAETGTHHVTLEVGTGEATRTVHLTVHVEDPEEVVEEGDTVKVRYVGRFPNGTVFGTNVKTIHESAIPKASFYRDTGFNLLSVPTAPGQGFIEGFRRGVLGVGANHTVTFAVPPALGFGNATIEETRPREETLNRTESFQRVFEERRQAFGRLLNESTQEGDVIQVPLGSVDFPFLVEHLNETHARLVLDVEPGDRLTPPQFQPFGTNASVVESVNETHVRFRLNVTEGRTLTFHDYWPNATEVVEVTEDTVVIRHTPEEGTTFQTQQGRRTITWTVEEVREDVIVTTRPNETPLAGKTTIFDVTVVEIQPAPEQEDPGNVVN